MYINKDRQISALTSTGQRKCGEFGTVVPSTMLCGTVVVVVSTIVLTTDIVQYGEVDKLTNRGKNLSWSILIIVVQISAVVTKNLSGT
jgi:choline-glycine betaine transporter